MLFSGNVVTIDDSGRERYGEKVEYSFTDKEKLIEYMLTHDYVFLGEYDDGNLIFNKMLNHWTHKRLTLRQKK